jgi:hypothetical protein
MVLLCLAMVVTLCFSDDGTSIAWREAYARCGVKKTPSAGRGARRMALSVP